MNKMSEFVLWMRNTGKRLDALEKRIRDVPEWERAEVFDRLFALENKNIDSEPMSARESELFDRIITLENRLAAIEKLLAREPEKECSNCGYIKSDPADKICENCERSYPDNFTPKQNEPKEYFECGTCEAHCSSAGMNYKIHKANLGGYCCGYIPKAPTYTPEQWAVFKALRVLGFKYITNRGCWGVWEDLPPTEWFQPHTVYLLTNKTIAVLESLIKKSDTEVFEIPTGGE